MGRQHEEWRPMRALFSFFFARQYPIPCPVRNLSSQSKGREEEEEEEGGKEGRGGGRKGRKGCNLGGKRVTNDEREKGTWDDKSVTCAVPWQNYMQISYPVDNTSSEAKTSMIGKEGRGGREPR